MRTQLIVFVGILVLGIGFALMADTDTNQYGTATATTSSNCSVTISAELAATYQEPATEFGLVSIFSSGGWDIYLGAGFSKIDLGGLHDLSDFGIDLISFTKGVGFSLGIPSEHGGTTLATAGDDIQIIFKDVDEDPIFFLTVNACPAASAGGGSGGPTPADLVVRAMGKLPCLTEDEAWQLMDLFGMRAFASALIHATDCENFADQLYGYKVDVIADDGTILVYIESLLTGEVPTELPNFRYLQIVKLLDNGSYAVLVGQWWPMYLEPAMVDGVVVENVLMAQFTVQDLLDDIQGGPGTYLVIPVLGDWTQSNRELWESFTIP